MVVLNAVKAALSKTCYPCLVLLLFFFPFLFWSNHAFGTHAQSGDLTYECLGGNQYRITVKFYRDCAGVNAPGTVTIDLSSASCNQNFTTTLNPLPGTGQEVTPICSSLQTQCNGGTYPGVQEWVYEGVVTLPAACVDWVFSFTLCCRNNAITTINNPGGENIYIEANLDNLNYPCNSSPVFSNPPVPFVCVGQQYCFNHGATDPDGDSLAYYLIAPQTGPATTVTYLPGYSATQPLQSSTAITIDPLTGDICMTPTLIEVTVMAVLVEEYRNGVLIGTIVRDIQLRSFNCSNVLPSLNGIANTGVYTIGACANTPLTFDIPSFDPDAGQTVSLTWNGAIPNATFTVNGMNPPTATFTWTPPASAIGNVQHCFTVTVTDDNCPFIGLQTYAFCINVDGLDLTMSATNDDCGTMVGTATATPIGGQAPFTYNWNNGGTTPTISGLAGGTYTVTVTDANGCADTDNVTVVTTTAPTLTMTTNNVNCHGANDGSLTVNVNGGTAPYSYLWSNGDTINSINGLAPGTYTVAVTTADGCTAQSSAAITQPNTPLTIATSSTDVVCSGGMDGTAGVIAIGGTGPYTYTWNAPGNPVTSNVNNLPAGTYSVTVTDNNGCTQTDSVTIIEPLPVTPAIVTTQIPSCNGYSDGNITVQATGGTGTLTYSWNTLIPQTGTTATNLAAGTYTVTVTDINGCSGSLNVTLGQPNPLITQVFLGNNVTCNAGNDGSLFSNTTGGTPPYSMVWDSQPNQYTATASNLLAGSYTMTVTDSNGCIATASEVVTEPAPITLTTSPDDTICAGALTLLDANATGGNGGFTYTWNNIQVPGSSISVNPSSDMWYVVQVTDQLGCVGPLDSIQILINDINLAQLTVGGGGTICEGEDVSFWAAVNGGHGIYTMNWSCGCIGGGPHIVAPNSSANYIVTVTDECANSLQDTVEVIVNPLPVLSINNETAEACGEAEVNFTNQATSDPGTSFLWDFDNGTLSTAEHPEAVFTNSGLYNVIVTATSEFGCVNADTVTADITVHPQARADFYSDSHDADVYNPQVRFVNTSVNATFYQWTFGDGALSADINPVHTYTEKGEYLVTLIANNNANCPDTISELVHIDPVSSIYVPNAFTPDGDGHNEVFQAVGEELVDVQMQIFNRWGQLIFVSESIDMGWDGNYKGQPADSEVYVYKIKAIDTLGEHHDLMGHVTLVR